MLKGAAGLSGLTAIAPLPPFRASEDSFGLLVRFSSLFMTILGHPGGYSPNERRKETEMKRTLASARLCLTLLVAGLASLAPEAARAAAPTAYTIQPIVKLGDQV